MFLKLSFLIFLACLTTQAKNRKFEINDCLYFEADEKAGAVSAGAVWKVVGVSKGGKYILRIHGGRLVVVGTKNRTFSESGWSKNLEMLTVQNTDKDGTKVNCPDK